MKPKPSITNSETRVSAPRSGRRLPRPGYGDVRDKLSDRQWLYVQAYATSLDHSKAMEEAGYSPNTRFQCTREIREAIQLVLMESDVGLRILPGALLKQYIEIADRCMGAAGTKEGVGAGEGKFDPANAIRALENVSKATKLFSDGVTVNTDEFTVRYEQILRDAPGPRGLIRR